MNRRHFLGTSLGTLAAAAAAHEGVLAAPATAGGGPGFPPQDDLPSPEAATLGVKPVMTNIIHTGVWEGPCRWREVSPADEKRHAEQSFARWSKALHEGSLARHAGVELLEPAHITFSEDFKIGKAHFDRLAADAERTDAFLLYPAGSSISAYEIGARFNRPILLQGLNCRVVDIAAYTRARGHEAFAAADDKELDELLSLLRARKVFRQTRVLFPTDRGLPAACSVGSVWDLEDLENRLGVAVKTISYKELAEGMEAVLADARAKEGARAAAEALLAGADKSFIERPYVIQSLLFYQAVRGLMCEHRCNAFTIECFEFCSSKLPDQWQITPCLIHSLQRDLGHASSCEGDLGSLLAMRMLMTVAGRSCHQGNSDPRPEETFRINHSVPARKMRGFDQPGLPYQLGRFVTKGWGTKMVVDFVNGEEKTITIARVDPTARRLLVVRGELVASSGWDQDLIGCSVEARIKAPAGRLDAFLRKRLEYGNHLQWVYGDWCEPVRRLGEMSGLEVEVIA